MPSNSYGIVVEGGYDSAVYHTIIRRLASHDVRIIPFLCDGKPNLLRKFPNFLEAMRYQLAGAPVDMAIVIADADGQDPADLEARMKEKVVGRQYPFELHFYAVRQAMEAWLLADAGAISKAVQARTGKRVTRTHDEPESLLDPKAAFRGLLSRHRVDYTLAVASEIAEAMDFRELFHRCPRTRMFAELVDC